MSIAYGGIVAFLFRGMNVVVALVTLVLTSNQLGADGRGTFVLGVTAVGIVSALTPEMANRIDLVEGVLPPGFPQAARVGALALAAAAGRLEESVAALRREAEDRPRDPVPRFVLGAAAEMAAS